MASLSLACLLLLLVQAASVHGMCYTDLPYLDQDTGFEYCMADDKVRFEVDNWHVTPSCFNCSCNARQMSCCGVGIRAGAIVPPAGHKIQMIPSCEYRFVLKSK